MVPQLAAPHKTCSPVPSQGQIGTGPPLQQDLPQGVQVYPKAAVSAWSRGLMCATKRNANHFSFYLAAVDVE